MYKNIIFVLLFFTSCEKPPSFEIINKDLEAEIIKYTDVKGVPYGNSCNTKSIILFISQQEFNENRILISLSCNESDMCRNYVGNIDFRKQKLSLCIYPDNESMRRKISELVKINYYMSPTKQNSIFEEFTDVEYIYENGILKLDTFYYDNSQNTR